MRGDNGRRDQRDVIVTVFQGFANRMESSYLLRDYINPDCGVILSHHTKKLSKLQVKDGPFLALSGASALRGLYTSGRILHCFDEDAPERNLEIELRNGPALATKLIDRAGGAWVEISPMNERLVRAVAGAKHVAKPERKGEVIATILLDEAMKGKMYTMSGPLRRCRTGWSFRRV